MEKNKWGWIGNHADTAAVLSSVLGVVIWMNAQFNGIHTEALKLNMEIRSELGQVKTDVAIIKTIMIMKGIMPCELAEKSE